MTRIALALFALAATPLLAQPGVPPAPPTTQAAPERVPATVRVSLQTSEGPIVLQLEKERAPVTTANFLRYVDQKRLDGVSFYRAMQVAPGFGFVQAGTRNDPKRVLPPIAHEPTSQTGLAHLDGTISMARYGPGTASGDFFILVGPIPSFDADPAQPGDNLGFAAFGRVVEGMEVIRRILEAPTSATEGEGPMKGQMLAAPVRILRAQRVQ
jgi:peptidyl-prolyl cis-trans isomerase A (cyclophilin A)